MPLQPQPFVDFAELVRDTGLARLWTGQSLSYEPHQLFSYLAGRGLRIPVGTAVSVMPLQHPFEAALAARSLALFSGRSVVAGFGYGSADMVALLRGTRYASPLTATREYLSMVRALVNGERVMQAGEYHHLEGMLPPMPSEHPRVEIGAGVLRPGMARVVGETADVAITWLTPLPHVRDVLAPAIRAGAHSRGRAVPRIVSIVHFAVDRPGRSPRELVLAANRGHLSMPHYTAMLRGAGVNADPSDPAAGASALVDSGVFVTGTAGEIASRVTEYLHAKVDEVVLSPAGVMLQEGTKAALIDVHEVVAELGSAFS
jgi:alkanesulfonate monooxygenase SsuD/methylene tetrahydromethanopterin reductase-like flavin-dependent oxidoreductase (luciferase family)